MSTKYFNNKKTCPHCKSEYTERQETEKPCAECGTMIKRKDIERWRWVELPNYCNKCTDNYINTFDENKIVFGLGRD